MILKHIILENIRSYIKQRIDFPQGSILLSGDIGTGKSTILLSIEFALFGLLRGEISGSSLLRHGEKTGSVELCFNCSDEEIIIKRSLKRNHKGIEQDCGHIIRNNVLKESTPVELKSEILAILGYPQELLSKSRNVMYRYTVFTPQEDMKKILFDSEEERLNILRKIFGIDKYKLVKENCEIYARFLRDYKRNLEGKIFDLDEKSSKLEKLNNEISIIQDSMSLQSKELLSAKELVDKKKLEIDSLKCKLEKINDEKSELKLLQNDLKKNNEVKNKLVVEDERLKINILELENQTKSASIKEEVKAQDLEIIKKLILGRELIVQKFIGEIASINARIEDSENTKNKIQNINTCLLCMQDVSDEHKKRIILHENERLKPNVEKLASLKKDKERETAELIKLKNDLESKQFLLRQHEIFGLKKKLAEEKKERSKQLVFEVGELEKNNILLFDKINLLNEEIKKFSILEDHLANLNKEFEMLSSKERSKEIEIHKHVERLELIKKLIEDLEKELFEKRLFKKKIEQISKLEYWLKEYFISLAELIERHVLSRVYNEFNDLFKSWFAILIEDDLLTVQLSDSFTPIIQQNGYDASIESLSGGEKTACALAYRLALNKAINNVVSTINTKDLLILDEPTDGFSEHQLDKIRDVLNELRIKQTIIVSHEEKIESFVDNVIRINKNEHVSQLISAR